MIEATTEESDVPQIAIRVVSTGERRAINYVADSWLKTSQRLAPWRWMDRADYWRDHRATVFAALESPRCTVLVATLSDDDDLFLGAVCFEPAANAIHWVQTKGPFRGSRVALEGNATTVSRALIDAAGKRGIDLLRAIYTTAPDGSLDHAITDTRGESTGETRPGHGLLCCWQRRGWAYNPYPLIKHWSPPT